MKIIHLMKPEKFTQGIALFYDTHFNNGEHEVCYVNERGKESLINPSLTIKQTEFFLTSGSKKDLMALEKYLCQYNYIVMHSLFLAHYTMFLHPKLIKKIVWIAWGYDLYNWLPDSASLKSKINFWIGTYIRNHCAAFVGIFPPDCDVFREKFPKSKAKVYYAPYCGAEIPEEYKHYSEISNLDKRSEDNEPIYIQIGHSAVKSVNHIKVLDDLRHLKDENIRLFLPLSYGDRQYGEKVQQYAIASFGDKAICLRDFMPKDQYFALLDRVDIAVFNTQRQIGLGNINRMLFRNVKVYISEGSVMYQYFTNQGVPIQKCEDLQEVTFEELKRPVKTHQAEKFGAFIESYRDMDGKVQRWKTIYTDLND